MEPQFIVKRKTYECPTLKRLPPKQAVRLLMGHTCLGDQGAKDLLALLFPTSRDEPLNPGETQESPD